MNGLGALLAGVGTLLLGVAAWAAYLSPRARASRDQQADNARRSHAVYQALFGTPVIYDESGAEILQAKQGLVADMLAVRQKLNAPILNGRGNELLKTVDRVDRRTDRLSRRVGTIEKHLTTSGDTE